MRLLLYSITKVFSLELSEVLVSEQGSDDWSEIAEEGEGVVDDGGIVFAEVKLRFEVNHKNGYQM
jgi:hypothetical protein